MIWREYKHKCRFKHNIEDAPWLEDRECLVAHEHGFAPNPLCTIFIQVYTEKEIDFKLVKKVTTDAVGALDIMYKLVMNGEGAFIIGNHERKLEKYFNQKEEGNVRIEIKGGLVKTLEQLDRLDENKAKMFESKFRALMNHARHHIILEREDGASMFVHAASSQKMWDFSNFSYSTST